jgi:hypothetical protein
VVVLAALVLSVVPAAVTPQSAAGAPTIPVRASGTGYCLNAPLRIGNIVIPSGQCYNFYLVRTAAQSFLGVGPGGNPLVPQGDRLQYGDRVRSNFRYMIPLGIGLTNIPQNSVALAAVQFLLQNNQLVLSVPVGYGRTYYLHTGGLPQER